MKVIISKAHKKTLGGGGGAQAVARRAYNLSCSNTKETLERRFKKPTEIEGSWGPTGVRGGSFMEAGVVNATFRVCWNQAHKNENH
jgi:hypothetical protein